MSSDQVRVDRDPESELVDVLTRWAAEELGPVEVVADRSRQRTRALVLEITGAGDRRWFIKRPGITINFTRERTAYRTFLPQVGGSTPRLRAASKKHQALLLTPVPGRSAEEADLRDDHQVHRRAGEWAARLHASARPRPAPEAGPAMARRLRLLSGRNVEALGEPTSGYLRTVVERLGELTDAPVVPCHLDYTPRNWLVRDDGDVGVVDFCTSGLSFAMHDFARLAVRLWPQRPDLREAFLEGYGQALGADEQAVLECCSAVVAVALLNKASKAGNTDVAAQCLRTLAQLQAQSSLRGSEGRCTDDSDAAKVLRHSSGDESWGTASR